MPRTTIDLQPYKAEIISLFQNGNSADSIVKQLQNKYNFEVAEHTIKSRLQEWGIRKRNCMTTSDSILHARIKVLFYEVGLEEKDML